LSEGRALYNLGNVYHAKGKHIGRVGQQDPGEFPEEVKVCIEQAVKYYEYIYFVHVSYIIIMYHVSFYWLSLIEFLFIMNNNILQRKFKINERAK